MMRQPASLLIFVFLTVQTIFGSPLYTVFFPYMHHPLVRQMLPTEPVVIELETAYECTQEGSYSDPDSCDSYYVCNTTPEGGLKAHIVNCPPGLQFNTEKNICDWPTGACQLPGEVAPCDSLQGEARRLCQERLAEIPQVEPVVIELETDLLCTESGIFADPFSCNKYYSCNELGGSMESFSFDCPPGLLFNAEAKECDWAASVDCSIQEQMEIEACASGSLPEQLRILCQANRRNVMY